MPVKIIIFAPEAVWQRRAGLTAHPALTPGSAVTQGWRCLWYVVWQLMLFLNALNDCRPYCGRTWNLCFSPFVSSAHSSWEGHGQAVASSFSLLYQGLFYFKGFFPLLKGGLWVADIVIKTLKYNTVLHCCASQFCLPLSKAHCLREGQLRIPDRHEGAKYGWFYLRPK